MIVGPLTKEDLNLVEVLVLAFIKAYQDDTPPWIRWALEKHVPKSQWFIDLPPALAAEFNRRAGEEIDEIERVWIEEGLSKYRIVQARKILDGAELLRLAEERDRGSVLKVLKDMNRMGKRK